VVPDLKVFLENDEGATRASEEPRNSGPSGDVRSDAPQTRGCNEGGNSAGHQTQLGLRKNQSRLSVEPLRESAMTVLNRGKFRMNRPLILWIGPHQKKLAWAYQNREMAPRGHHVYLWVRNDFDQNIPEASRDEGPGSGGPRGRRAASRDQTEAQRATRGDARPKPLKFIPQARLI
jgi:hypothetical protein